MEIQKYNQRGYIFPLDVFSDAEIAAHRNYFDELTAMAGAAGLDNYGINALARHWPAIRTRHRDDFLAEYLATPPAQ